MHRFLAFRLYGAMASWGEIAVGSERGSADHPTRSALLGFVASALGLRRDDLVAQAALARSLRFAARVDLPGTLMRDYHTTSVAKPQRNHHPATRRESLQTNEIHCITSQRYYYCDAHYTIVAWCETNERWTLAEILDALRHPVWIPYLGRRGCPLGLPHAARIVEAASLRDALKETQFPMPPGLSKMQSDSVRVYWEDTRSVSTGLHADHVFERRDDPIPGIARHFTVRRELQTTLPTGGVTCS